MAYNTLGSEIDVLDTPPFNFLPSRTHDSEEAVFFLFYQEGVVCCLNGGVKFVSKCLPSSASYIRREYKESSNISIISRAEALLLRGI